MTKKVNKNSVKRENRGKAKKLKPTPLGRQIEYGSRVPDEVVVSCTQGGFFALEPMVRQVISKYVRLGSKELDDAVGFIKQLGFKSMKAREFEKTLKTYFNRCVGTETKTDPVTGEKKNSTVSLIREETIADDETMAVLPRDIRETLVTCLSKAILGFDPFDEECLIVSKE